MMRSPDASNPTPTALPPGARAGRILGALALGFAFCSIALVWFAVDPLLHPWLFLAIPVFLMFLSVLPLSLAAMVFEKRARRRAVLAPGDFRSPGRVGLTLGLLAIGVWVFVLLLMVPLLAGRSVSPRVRDRAVISNMEEGVSELAMEYEKAAAEGLGEAQRLEALERLLASWQDRRNPWNRRQPWLHPHVFEAEPGEAAAEAVARERATVLGQSVFVLSAPGSKPAERWLAGAVLNQGRNDKVPSADSRDRIRVKTRRLAP